MRLKLKYGVVATHTKYLGFRGVSELHNYDLYSIDNLIFVFAILHSIRADPEITEL